MAIAIAMAFAAGIPLVVIGVGACLAIGNRDVVMRGRHLATMHQRLLDNVRKAVDKAGRDGLGPVATELWKREVPYVVDWVVEQVQEAENTEERLEKIEDFMGSGDWEEFWTDLENVTDYAWIVGLRHDLEAWAREAIDNCPRTAEIWKGGELVPLRKEAARAIHGKLARLYQRYTEERDANQYMERLSEELLSAVDQIAEAAAVSRDEAEMRAVRAWAEVTRETLKDIVRAHMGWEDEQNH